MDDGRRLVWRDPRASRNVSYIDELIIWTSLTVIQHYCKSYCWSCFYKQSHLDRLLCRRRWQCHCVRPVWEMEQSLRYRKWPQSPGVCEAQRRNLWCSRQDILVPRELLRNPKERARRARPIQHSLR